MVDWKTGTDNVFIDLLPPTISVLTDRRWFWTSRIRLHEGVIVIRHHRAGLSWTASFIPVESWAAATLYFGGHFSNYDAGDPLLLPKALD